METINKPWLNEPDLLVRDVSGYHLVVRRSPSTLNLNGYIGVPMTHPLYGANYNRLNKLDVHGGVTFSGKVTAEGFKNKYWYIGFDTSHAFDASPLDFDGNGFMHPKMNRVYRDMQFVVNESAMLAMQIIDVKANNPQYKTNHVKIYRRMKENSLGS